VLQLVAPDHLRGRITSVLQVQPVCIAIGALFSGAAADVVGVAVIGAALSFTAFGIGVAIFVFSPRMRGLRLSAIGGHTASRDGR
jgi:hypothetical protein